MIAPGRSAYSGSTRNGVTSQSSGSFDGSFTIAPSSDVGRIDCNAFGVAGRKSGAGTTDSAGGSIADDIAKAAKDAARSAADEAKQETKNAAKEEARGAADDAKAKAKCALGGLLGRKKC